jgi:hypothetical protein
VSHIRERITFTALAGRFMSALRCNHAEAQEWRELRRGHGIVITVVEMMWTSVGASAGQFVTCGSLTGLRSLGAGDACEVRFAGQFAGLGAAQLIVAP